MDVGRIPKEVLYGQLTTGVRKVGHPALRFMDASKRDLKACEIDPNNWEVAASDRARWRRTVKEGIEKADVKRHQKAEEKRARRENSSTLPGTQYHSRIGLHSHTGRCSTTTD